jgi:hypothetical protein
MPQFDVNSYIDVQERIGRFWQEYPDGRIDTNIMSPPDDFSQCRYVARVYKELNHSVPAATGWAFEIAGGGGANRTSHEENCETSAIGRALANMGYATSGKDRPSKQEMTKAKNAEAIKRMAREPFQEHVDDRTDKIAVAGITPEQKAEMGRLGRGLNWHIAHRQNWLKKRVGTVDINQISEPAAAKLIDELRHELDADTQRGLEANSGQEALLR